MNLKLADPKIGNQTLKFILMLVALLFGYQNWDLFFGIDEGIYLFGSELVLRGQIPHLDFFSMLPPGVYWVGAFFLHFFGPKILALRIFLTLLSGLNAVLIYSIIRKATQAGKLASFVGGFFYIWNAIYENRFLSHNSFSLPLCLFAVTLFVLAPQNASPRRKIFLLGSAFSVSLASLFSQNIAVYTGALLVMCTFFHQQESPEGSLKKKLKEAGMLLFVLALLPLLLLIFYATRNGLTPLVDQTFFSLFKDYYSVSSQLSFRYLLQDVIEHFPIFFIDNHPWLKAAYVYLLFIVPPVLAATLSLAHLIFHFRKKQNPFYPTSSVAFFGGGLWLITLTGNFWEKYLMYSSLLYALGIALLAKRLMPLFEKSKAWRYATRMLMIILLAGVSLYRFQFEKLLLKSCFQTTRGEMCIRSEPEEANAIAQVAQFLNHRLGPNTCLLAWPYSAEWAFLYPNSNVTNLWIYHSYSHFHENILSQLIEDLKICPDLVIVQDLKYERARKEGDPRKTPLLEDTPARLLFAEQGKLRFVGENEYYRVFQK